MRRVVAAGLVLLTVAVMVAAAACSPQEEGGTATPGPTLAPESLLQARCTTCHNLGRTTSAQKTALEWEQTVQRMRGIGARLSDEEAALLVSYLAATYK